MPTHPGRIQGRVKGRSRRSAPERGWGGEGRKTQGRNGCDFGWAWARRGRRGARGGLNALGCVPLAPPPIRPIIGTPFLSFLAGGTHICRPRAHLAARDRHEWGRQTALRQVGTKKAGLGFANPKLVSGNIRKLRHGQTVRKSPKKLHPISTGGSGDSKTFTHMNWNHISPSPISTWCQSWRESPRRVWRLGARTSEERPEERREQQQVRDVSDDSRRPSLEPVARGGSPRGIPRGRRRRAPSPRSGRCGRTHHHRARLRAPRRRFDRRSHPASRGAPPTRGDAMLVVAVPFESHRFRVLRARAPGSAVC